MSDTTVELRDYIRIIKKRYRLILNTCLVLVIVSMSISFITPPTYEAVASLRIKTPQSLANSLLADPVEESSLNTQKTMATYAEMLKSRTVVQAVIDKTKSDIKHPLTYEQLAGAITIQPAKDADILYVRVQSYSPDEAQLIANTLTETLISLVTSEQGVVREFIGQRLKDSKQELEQAESALEKYKREQKMIAPDVQSKAMADKFSTIDKLIAENSVNLATAQAKLGSVQQQLDGEKPGFIADSPLIQQYKSKLADLEVELAKTLPQYTDNHPKVTSLKAAIVETKSKLNIEAARVVNAEAASGNPVHQSLLQGEIAAEAEVAAALAQKEAIGNIVANGEKDLAALPAKEQGITRLMREVQVAQEMYIMLDKRYEEARINEVMRPSDVKVLDAAVAPRSPVKPRKMLNAVIGAIIGVIIGTAWASYLEYTKRTILSDREAEQILDLPVMGVMPDFDKILIAKPEPFWHKIRSVFFSK